MKRAFDVTLSGFLLFLFSPLLLVIGLRIRRDGGPALYRGVRAGRGGIPFNMLKFRSMVVNADNMGPPSTAADDRRISPLGRKLRAYKLDELPQLINVLRGEMSLVGPRPEILDEVARYTPEQRRILDVRPGITDWASIKYRNEGEILAGSDDPHGTYLRLIQPGKLRLGIHYVETSSMLTDLRILAITAISIVDHERALKMIPVID